MTASVSVLVLTHNEEVNIPSLLQSVHGWAEAIYVIDSGSTDQTVEIAESYGACVKYNPWKTHATQINWALENCPISTDWVMRMDADEIVTPELAVELCDRLSKVSPATGGFYVKRRVYFMNRWIRHGGLYPTWLLRIFRTGKARCEDLRMDEHMVLTEGMTEYLAYDIIDFNRKGLTFWSIKHEGYAEREAIETLVNSTASKPKLRSSLVGSQAERKRWLKTNFYARSPLFLRAFTYFLYRYFLRFGFLDGEQGLIFHVLQGFWYRFYVDAKVFEQSQHRLGGHVERNEELLR